MTNKTVTLSREQEVLREIIRACDAAKSHGYISMLAEDALADPVPPAVCATCNGTGIEYDGAGHTCTACNGKTLPTAGGEGLPERRPDLSIVLVDNHDHFMKGQDIGWNSCLDEIRRLNR